MMNMRFMKIAIIGIVGLSMLSACARIKAGEEGVRVENFGSGDGVQEEELGVGYHFKPPGVDIIAFPLYEQTFVWDLEVDERGNVRSDESFSVQDRDGMRIGIDLGIRFEVVPGRPSDLVSQFRNGLTGIVDGRIRNMIRTSLNNQASRRSAEDIYGEGREEFLRMVYNDVEPDLRELGLQEIELYWVSELRLPEQVRQAIANKIEAEQEALRRERQVETARQEAEIAIQQARGESESRLLRANAEAEALRIQGAAIRENPEVLTLNAIEAWASGAPVPQTIVIGGAEAGVIPFLDVERRQQ